MTKKLKNKVIIEKPQYITKPNGTKVLVIAPHPDDEVIGCGGTLLKHISCGDKVLICYITSTINSKCDRRQEALNANRIMEVTKSVFFYMDEKAEVINDIIIEKLSEIIVDFAPEIIYVPHILERHIDHLNSNILLYYSLLKIKNSNHNIKVYCYEVWTTLVPNCVVNITDYNEKKIETLLMYQSQLNQYDYVKLVDSLGRLRCNMFYPDKREYNIVINDYRFSQKYCNKTNVPWTHAEAFTMYKIIEYKQLINDLLLEENK